MTTNLRRFSLRTLFVMVTVACVWLGWQVNIVRERRAVKEMLRSRNFGMDGLPGAVPNTRRRHIPWIRSLLGDDSVAQIYLDGDAFSSDEIRRMKTIYPETQFTIVNDMH